jgi:putative endonuclease
LSDNTYYHGSSDDLKQRYQYHKLGKVYSTRNKRPLKLVFYAAFSTKEKATAFEKYLKSSSGFAFRNELPRSKLTGYQRQPTM